MKKIISIILAVFMIAGMLSVMIFADDAAEATPKTINGLLRYEVDAAKYINDEDDRGNLSNLAEAMADKKITVAYIGGSVTYGQGAFGQGYVNRVTEYFEGKGISVDPVYTGIGSTGSRLGAFRMQQQIIDRKPDLVFLEYAVNDPYYPEGNGKKYEGLYFEYAIREVRRQLPKAEIIVLFATNAQYAHRGGKFDSFGVTAVAQEEIAKHYGAVSIDVGGYVVESLYGGRTPTLLSNVNDRNSVNWGTPNDDVIAWQRFFGTKDIVHPNADGYKLYAEAIGKYLDGAFEAPVSGAKEYTLPEKSLYGADIFLAKQVDLTAEDTVIKGFNYEKLTPSAGNPYYEMITPQANGPWSITFPFDGRCDQLALFVTKVPAQGDYKFEILINDADGNNVVRKTGDLRSISYRRHILIMKSTDLRKLDKTASYTATINFLSPKDGKSLTTCNICSIMLGGKEIVWENPYKDVAENAWYYNNVKFVSEKSIMDGMSTTEFKPDTLLTREMLVTSLYKNEGSPAVTGENKFTDVSAGSAYEKAVMWAAQNGIVNGISETQFAPNANITREQIATIIFRYANFKKQDTAKTADLSTYTDAPTVSTWAKEAMQYTVASGLIGGKTPTTLNPKDSATRAEIATILQRFIAPAK